MRQLRNDQGLTLIELLTAIVIFAILSVSFYQVLFMQTRGSETARSVAEIADEARPGFNRMVRDTREGDLISAASPTAFTVKVNFDGDSFYEMPNGAGDAEILTYAYDEAAGTVTLNGETLMSGVDCLPADVEGPCSRDVFSSSSNLLEYDWNDDGRTTWQEIDETACASHGIVEVGDCDTPPTLDASELPYLNIVSFALDVHAADESTEFVGVAQLRNRQ